MLRDRVVRVGDFLFRSMHVWLLRHGVIPIHILFCELGAAIGSAIAIAQRRMTIGCSALIFHGLLDYMDGGLQRTAKGLKISLPPYGSAHTVIDKFSDAILFAGFAIGGFLGIGDRDGCGCEPFRIMGGIKRLFSSRAMFV